MNKEEPSACPTCGYVDWRNPKPVVVCVQETVRGGVVVIQRGLRPVGGWAFPGGFIDENEDIETAATREFLEETGFYQPDWDYMINRMGLRNDLLIFMQGRSPIDFDNQGEISTPDEVLDVQEVFESIELCYLSHQDVLNEFFPLGQ